MEWLLGLAWWVGLVTVLYFVVYPLRELYKRWLRPAADLARYRKDGAWAVVTGGSDGIGKAFAEELAKRGFPVLLMARTKDKLEKVAAEIGKKYGVKTAILAVDFTRIEDSATLESIEEAINKCGPVSVLVNNVGMAYPFPHRFLDAPKEMDRDIMNVNVRAITDLTRIVLPGMVKRKTGAIINLSSITGRAPAPMLPTYSATKAYDYFFSVSLSAEYARDGIAVQCITPGLVASNMTRFRNKNTVKGIGTPDDVAKGSLDTLGYEIHWAPFWVHAFQIFLSKYLSRQFVLDSMLRIGEEARAYRLNRQAQSKKQS